MQPTQFETVRSRLELNCWFQLPLLMHLRIIGNCCCCWYCSNPWNQWCEANLSGADVINIFKREIKHSDWWNQVTWLEQPIRELYFRVVYYEICLWHWIQHIPQILHIEAEVDFLSVRSIWQSIFNASVSSHRKV